MPRREKQYGLDATGVAVKTMVPESVVKLLVRAGARVDTYDNAEFTLLLDIALRKGWDIATLLPSSNASKYINHMYDNKFTALVDSRGLQPCLVRPYGGERGARQCPRRETDISLLHRQLSRGDIRRRHPAPKLDADFQRTVPKINGRYTKGIFGARASGGARLRAARKGRRQGSAELIRAANVAAGLLYDGYEAGYDRERAT